MFELNDYFQDLNEDEDVDESVFLRKLVNSLLGIKTIFERNAYYLKNCSFEIRDTLVFANESDCKVELSKLLQKEFLKYSNFDLYQYCMHGSTFKQLLLETTSMVCVFIGLQFPAAVSTPEELFELYHAVYFFCLFSCGTIIQLSYLKACMQCDHYRSFATDPHYLTRYTNLMMFVLKFTRTTGVKGGRGSYFMTLVTENLLRHTQLCLSKVLRKFFETTTNYQKDPDQEIINSIHQENRCFAMQAFYAKAAKYNVSSGVVSIVEIPEIATEKSPWDWFITFFEDTKLFKDDGTNLMSPTWYSRCFDVYKNIESKLVFQNAWTDDQKLTKYAPSRIADFIRAGLQPHAYTANLLLAVYHQIGFEIPLTGTKRCVHDIIGPRLEAFCRLYIGTVFEKYLIFNETTNRYVHRDHVLIALSDPKGLVFHKGNQYSSKFSKDDTARDTSEGKL